tara:strand:- start:459 stop:671 length:213 start_codon:yes stop_codon:yes gene_type:complete
MTLQDKLEKSLSVALAMRGMKQKDLAVKMSCTAVYISNLMKDGRLSVAKLDSVASALDFTLWEFTRLGEQ